MILNYISKRTFCEFNPNKGHKPFTQYLLSFVASSAQLIVTSIKNSTNFIKFHFSFVPKYFIDEKNSTKKTKLNLLLKEMKEEFVENKALAIGVEITALGYVFLLLSYFSRVGVESFNNEMFWFISLLVILGSAMFAFSKEMGQIKINLQNQIDLHEKLVTETNELLSEMVCLEKEFISQYEYKLALLEAGYCVLETASKADIKIDSVYYEATVNKLFAEHFKYLTSLAASRESQTKNIFKKEINEEIVSETFEEGK